MPKQLHPESRTRLAKRFLTIDEFADLTGISRPTIYEKMRRREIPFDASSGRRRIPVSYVDHMERAAFANAKRRASAC